MPSPDRLGTSMDSAGMQIAIDSAQSLLERKNEHAPTVLVKELSKMLHRVLEQAKRQTNNVKNLKEQLRSSQIALMGATEENLKCLKNLHEESKKHDEVARQNQKLAKTMQKLKGKRELAMAERDAVRAEAESIAHERDNALQELDDLRRELEDTRSSLSALAEEHSTCTSSHNRSKDALADAHAMEVEGLRQDVARMRKQVAELKEERLNMGDKLAEAHERIRDLEGGVRESSELEKVINEQRKQLVELKDAFQASQAVLQSEDREVADVPEERGAESDFVVATLLRIKADEAFNTSGAQQQRSVANVAASQSALRRSNSLGSGVPPVKSLQKDMAQLLTQAYQKRAADLEEAALLANSLRASQAKVVADPTAANITEMRKEHKKLGEVMGRLSTNTRHMALAKEKVASAIEKSQLGQAPRDRKLTADALKSQTKQWTERVRYLKEANAAGQAALSDDQATIDALWKLIISLLDNIGMLGRRVDALSAELETATATKQPQQEATTHEEDLAERTAWFQKEERQKEIDQIKNELEALMSHTRQNQANQEEVERLTALLSEREEQYHIDLALTREIEAAFLALKSNINSSHKKDRGLQMEMRAELEDLREQVAELEAEEDSLRMRNELMEEQIEALSQHEHVAEELREQVQAHLRTIEALEHEIADWEEKYDLQHTEFVQLRMQIATVENAMRLVECERDEAVEELEEHRGRAV